VAAPDELPEFADSLPELALDGPQIGGRPRERFAKALERGNFEWAAAALAVLEVEEPHSLDVPKMRLELIRCQNESAAKVEFLKGTVAHKKREWNEAYKHFEKASALDPRNATYVERAARAAAFQGEIKVAKQLAERAVELRPDDPTCRTTLGRVFQMAGMDRNAKREFEAALKLDPKQDFARSQMRKLWWKG
jgi:tetratricopeptide (TPR) repeat protein